MSILKNIQAAVILAGLAVSGSHAVMHSDHHHHAEIEPCGMAAEPCGIETEPCHCTPCETKSCTDGNGYVPGRTPDAPAIESISLPAPFFHLPDTRPSAGRVYPPGANVLKALRTVQLLI